MQSFDSPVILHKSINSNTAKTLLSMLEQVTSNPDGTGLNTYMEYINIGGKTGTGEIWDNQKNEYSSEEFFSSFASIFPIDNPKYVMIVSIEAPKYEYRWGSQTAVPCTKRIIENIILYDKSLMESLNNINELA